MNRVNARSRRGVAMLAVLVALLLLTVLASSFFMQARDSSSLGDISLAQTVATTNAEMGMQEAIRRIRSSQIEPVLIGTCTTAQVDANACPAAFSSGVISNSALLDPAQGGGLLYQFIVYQRPTFVDPGQPTNRYVIRATGFYGRTIDSIGLVTSVLEAEVDLGQGNRTQCVGSYECI